MWGGDVEGSGHNCSKNYKNFIQQDGIYSKITGHTIHSGMYRTVPHSLPTPGSTTVKTKSPQLRPFVVKDKEHCYEVTVTSSRSLHPQHQETAVISEGPRSTWHVTSRHSP